MEQESGQRKVQMPTVQNTVAFAELNLEYELDLVKIAQKVENCCFNMKRFPAIVFRRNEPKITVLLFKAGRMIVIGQQDEEAAEAVCNAVVRSLSRMLLQDLELTDFRITNIVANADLGRPVTLESLSGIGCVRKNERFPGMVFRGFYDIKSVLIFHSGKVVFTGCNSIDAIGRAFNFIRKELNRYDQRMQAKVEVKLEEPDP